MKPPTPKQSALESLQPTVGETSTGNGVVHVSQLIRKQ